MRLFKRKKVAEKKDKEQAKETVEVRNDKKLKKVEKPEDKKEVKEKKEGLKSNHDHSQAQRHLIRPLMTEKASISGADNAYLFEVSPRANKIEIKKAIEKLYSVKPIKVNIINLRGKTVRYGRNAGKMKNWKKAIVTLKAGDKIEVYEGT